MDQWHAAIHLPDFQCHEVGRWGDRPDDLVVGVSSFVSTFVRGPGSNPALCFPIGICSGATSRMFIGLFYSDKDCLILPLFMLGDNCQDDVAEKKWTDGMTCASAASNECNILQPPNDALKVSKARLLTLKRRKICTL